MIPAHGTGSLRAALPAALAAILLGAALVWAGGEEPLAGYRGAAAFLSLAVYCDLRFRRIPNALTLPALALALALGFEASSASGLLAALAGACVAAAIWLPPFAIRALGGGDLKALCVLGAFLGPRAALELSLVVVVLAGALALAIVAARGGLRELCERWHAALALTLVTRRLHYAAPQPASPAAMRLPLAPALALALSVWALGEVA
jgi:prepilin peptidase CpaA